MKSTIFSLIALIALLTSCDKESKDIEADHKVPGKANYVEDVSQIEIDGNTLRVGEAIPIRDLVRKFPTISNMIKVAPSTPNKRNAGWDNAWLFCLQYDECTCGAENCPDLGSELQGRKWTGWTQLDANSSGDPYAHMHYDLDDESLYNFSAGTYHQYRHINYNSKSELTFMFLIERDGDFIPSDVDYVDVGDYGIYTYVDSYSEVAYMSPLTNYDENAIVYQYSTCSSCDACN